MDKLVFGNHYRGVNETHLKDDADLLGIDYIPDSVILTRKELEERDKRIAEDAWDAGEAFGRDDAANHDWEQNDVTTPDKETYIKSLHK